MRVIQYFTVYWRDGQKTNVQGESIADAMNSSGYGAGALRAMDFYSEVDDYEWDSTARKWIQP